MYGGEGASSSNNCNIPSKSCAFIPSPHDEIKEWSSPKYRGFFAQVELDGKLLDRVECLMCKKRIGMNSRRLIREHYNLHYAEANAAASLHQRMPPAPSAQIDRSDIRRGPTTDLGLSLSTSVGSLFGAKAQQPQRHKSGSSFIEEEEEQADVHLGDYGGTSPSVMHRFEQHTTMKCERDLQLVAEIRRHSALYDPDDPHYRDNNRKTLIWEQIAQECGFSDGSIAARRWRSMRDYYLRLVRTSNNGEVKYTYAQELGFLLDFIDSSNCAPGVGNDQRSSMDELPLTEQFVHASEIKLELEHQLNNNEAFFMDKSGEQRGNDVQLDGTHQRQQQQQQQQSATPGAAWPSVFGTGGDHWSKCPSPSAPSPSYTALRRKRTMTHQQALSTSNFASDAVPPLAAVEEEDDAELFGRRVAKFLRSLSRARRRRQACIGIEHVMIQFEEEEEQEKCGAAAGTSSSPF